MFLRKISTGVLSPPPPPDVCQYFIFIRGTKDFHISQAEPTQWALSPNSLDCESLLVLFPVNLGLGKQELELDFAAFPAWVKDHL